MNEAGVVFHIQRFSTHDGPGIRTAVFLKGCPLRCFWCHNPEGQRRRISVRFTAGRCIACGACVSACPNQAQVLQEGGRRLYARERCQGSGECLRVCDTGALEPDGRTLSVAAVMEEVLRDKPFYDHSNGGVTLSGGEPAFQARFSRAILQQCRAAGIHTAIETCGESPWRIFEAMLPFVDLVMMDLKIADPEKHQRATGLPNHRIRANARLLALTGKPLIFRTPVVPTVNDRTEEIRAIAAFVRELRDLRAGHGLDYALLPFHRLGADKYAELGLEYAARDLQPPGKDHLQELLRAARQYVPDAHIG